MGEGVLVPPTGGGVDASLARQSERAMPGGGGCTAGVACILPPPPPPYMYVRTSRAARARPPRFARAPARRPRAPGLHVPEAYLPPTSPTPPPPPPPRPLLPPVFSTGSSSMERRRRSGGRAQVPHPSRGHNVPPWHPPPSLEILRWPIGSLHRHACSTVQSVRPLAGGISGQWILCCTGLHFETQIQCKTLLSP